MIISCLVYKDCPTSIEFLTQAFGFNVHMKVPDPDDKNLIAHAQLELNGHYIMCSSMRQDGEFGAENFASPKYAGHMNTSSMYVVVQDVQSHFEKAKAAGAKVIRALETQDYGGSGFTVLDLEGYLWSFGDYAIEPAQAT